MNFGNFAYLYILIRPSLAHNPHLSLGDFDFWCGGFCDAQEDHLYGR